MGDATRFRLGCPDCGNWTAPLWSSHYTLEAWNRCLFVDNYSNPARV
jgi:hypothetical protein